MPPERTTVFLPCHTLDDFPTWLEEAEADDLLAAWTAAWHPALLAAVGGPPHWASIDLPVTDGPLLGIVPATWDDRFAAQFDSACTVGSSFVRRVSGVEAIVDAAAGRLGLSARPLPGEPLAGEFQAVGLAALMAELLARRMRSHAELASTGFPAAVTTAARAAVAGRDDDARVALAEAFDAISATRARYYPVDSYVVDLVLLAASSGEAATAASIDSPVPVAIAVTGQAIHSLATTCPAAVASLRAAVAHGRVEPCGSRFDDSPIDLLTPESARESFALAAAQFTEHLGGPPASFARLAGGSAQLMPQVAAGAGLDGGIWTAFDGSPLPDVGGGVIHWRSGTSAVDLLAASPLDARSARTVLSLHESLGDALDRDHVAALLLAHYAGTASRWHDLLRRIGRSSNLLGTFVTPRELARRTTGAGTPVSLEPDAFPPSLPRDAAAATDRSISAALAVAAREARDVISALEPFAEIPAARSPGPQSPVAPPPRRWLSFGVPGGRDRGADRLVLANELIRVEVHARTGGLLSLRREAAAPNRLSQQLAIRSTRPAGAAGSGWESADDRATFTTMVADSIERVAESGGHAAVESRGRFLAAGGEVVGRFTQRVSLAAGLPVVVLDIDVLLERPLAGLLLENHVAARFAWNENEHVELRRSVLTQSVPTERTRFTAPHFIEIVPDSPRGNPATDTVTILTGGLPWHVRSTPHVVDAILAGDEGQTVSRRMAVGLGLRRPWEAALAFAAGAPLATTVPGVPDHVRLTVRDLERRDGRIVAARVGLLESAGRSGDVAVDWRRPVSRAAVVDAAGGPRQEPTVAIDGTRTVVSLGCFEWLQLDLEFAG